MKKSASSVLRTAQSAFSDPALISAEQALATDLMENAEVVTLPSDAHQTMTQLIEKPPAPTEALKKLMTQ